MRSLPAYEAALSDGGLPYVRIGEGKDPLVIFTSGSPDMSVPTGFMLRQFVDGARHFAEHYTVYFVKRKRGLPPDCNTRGLADDYAAFIEEEISQPCHILGISAGGFIAQHFAAAYPHLTCKLVIAIAGYQLQGSGRERVESWQTFIQDNQYCKLLTSMYTAASDTFLAALLALVICKLFRPPQADLNDFYHLLSALLAHDGRPSLPNINCPTLLIGGEKDIFYPPDILYQMAREMPNVQVSIYPRVGHGLIEQRKKEFEKEVLEFLAQ